MTTIWMWEATAAPGRGGDLRAWAVRALADRDGEVYASSQPGGELVVVVLRLPPAMPMPPEAAELPTAIPTAVSGPSGGHPRDPRAPDVPRDEHARAGRSRADADPPPQPEPATGDDARCPLPAAPAELTTGHPHAWRFEQIHPRR